MRRDVAVSLTLAEALNERAEWCCTALPRENFAKNAPKGITAVDNAMTSV
jgi:hypothetical protein